MLKNNPTILINELMLNTHKLYYKFPLQTERNLAYFFFGNHYVLMFSQDNFSSNITLNPLNYAFTDSKQAFYLIQM